jgi:hypothetical protein
LNLYSIQIFDFSHIFQCLLSGLSIVQPDDSIQWLIEKLEAIQDVGPREIKWYLFDEILSNFKSCYLINSKGHVYT